MSGMPSPSPARINGGDRDKDSMWYFSSDDLANSPSRKAGISPDQELSYRQMTAYLIQEMGQRLQVSQLCINTAIVYMHRFYAFHSFTHFHRNGIAAASLFLAAKVEEQPRKLEHVIKAANKCLNHPTTSTTETYYLEQAQDLVFNENVLLQTLGFDVAIDHPHTHVVKTCQLVKACKDLAQTSYFLASNSLHLTSMCLQYKPSVVACFCIYLACKWSRWEIPQSTEGKHWFHYVDETVTMDLLKKLTDEFIVIYEKSPARLKSKLTSIKALAQGASNRQGQIKDKKADQDWKVSDMMNMKMYHPAEASVSSGNQSQSSSSQYSSQGSVGADSLSQQQSGTMSQTMLPPPPHQTQQIRKPDLHTSSQHRPHHSSSSSSSSSHHPPKIGYSTGDIPDHKLNAGHAKQQQQPQPYSGSNIVSNRLPREHNSSLIASSSNKSSSSSSSSSRSSISNCLTNQPLRQSSSQGHPMDVNYHKSRERSLAVPPPPSGHNIPPHVMSHKLAQKQDGSRSMSSKDHSGRLVAEQANKQTNSNSSSSNKMFPSSVPSQYGGNNIQIPPGSNNGNQLSSKLDTMHDITRNIVHTSRSGYNNPPPPQPLTNGPTTPLLNFHQQQQQQGSRHSSNSSNNNNNSSSNSLKHEQSKQISVHMQQQAQTTSHHHKHQPLPSDQSYSGLGGAHELHQLPHVASTLVSNNYTKIEPLQHSEETPHPSNQYNQQAQNHAAKPSNSLFSPEWSDKLQVQQTETQLSQQVQPVSLSGCSLNNLVNSSGNLAQNSETYPAGGYKIPSISTSSKESSPPKIKCERDTPLKKEKNRSNSSNQDNVRPASCHVSAQQQMMKSSIPKKLDSSLTSSLTPLTELAGTSNMGTVGGIKRPNELVTIKQEDDLLTRDSKIRKIDISLSSDVGKHQVVNGIETNPDLVRNLLKESLCSTSGLLKTEPSIVTPSLQPPAELFEPSATTSINNQHNTSITSIGNNVLSGNLDVSAMETDDHGTSGNKSEKKKKKDKHKHKEKDKSKDREERKKHKKDKDRHKDKERDKDNDNGNLNLNNTGTAEHVKIKISKEKLEAAGEPIGFKIKIPKERIMGDINTGSSGQTNTDSVASHAPPVLKIKISKDKLESYNSGSTEFVTGLTTAMHPTSFSAYSAAGSHSNPSAVTHSGSSSSKKKDRDREKDRERDKDKKRSHDSTLSRAINTSGGVHTGLITAGIVGSNAANGSIAGQTHSNSNSSGNSSTQKYSSKMHHQSSMSLLFGESNESNDDDDDYNDDF